MKKIVYLLNNINAFLSLVDFKIFKFGHSFSVENKANELEVFRKFESSRQSHAGPLLFLTVIFGTLHMLFNTLFCFFRFEFYTLIYSNGYLWFFWIGVLIVVFLLNILLDATSNSLYYFKVVKKIKKERKIAYFLATIIYLLFFLFYLFEINEILFERL